MGRAVNFGYVGCGFVAQKVHIPNFMSIPGCNFRALAELRPKLGRRVQERYKVPRLYSSHLELAEDDEIEAVGISGGFHVQGEIARDMLRAGKHVFVEKPMAVTLKQGEGIIDAAKKGGAKIMVGYMKRYDAGNLLVKDLVDGYRKGGELGSVLYCRNHGFCGDWVAGGLDTPMDETDEPYPEQPPPPVPKWMSEEEYAKYVGYLQQYIHNINLMRWFLGSSDRVKVRGVDLDEDGYTGITVFDMDGVRAVLESGGITYYRWDEHTQIYFQHGWVQTWAPPLLMKNATAEVEVYRERDGAHEFLRPIPEDKWSWSYRNEAEHFIESVADDREFRSPGEDALIDIKLAEDVFRFHLKRNGDVGTGSSH